MIRTALSVSAFALLAFASFPALAAPAIDKAGADALKPRMAETLKHFTTYLAQSGMVLKQEGDLAVEPAGNYYAITTPALSVVMPNNVTRSIGMLAINAIPTDDPDVIKVALAIPTPMTDTAATGEKVGSVTIGQQNLGGAWHMKALSFTSLSGNYKDIRIVDTTKDKDTAIPSMTVSLNLVKGADNLWSGPTDIQMNDVTYKDKTTVANVASVRWQTSVDKLDILARRTAGDAPKKAAPAKKDDKDKQGFSFGEMLSPGKLVGQYATKYADGATTALKMENIRFKTFSKDGKGQAGTIASVVFSSGVSGLKGEKASGNWDLRTEGVTTEDIAMARFAPTRAALTGSFADVPVKALTEAKDKGEQMSALTKAGTRVTLDSLVFDAPAYGIDGKGSYQAPRDIGQKSSGSLSLMLRGLSDFATWLQSPNAPSMNGKPLIPAPFVAVIGMIQMAGAPAKDAQGRDVLSFDFKRDATGKTSLNGADISEMMKGMGGAGGSSGATTPAAPH